MIRRVTASVFLLGALLGLSACGFHSVYGSHSSDGSPVSEQLNQVAIESIADRPGQMLRNDLIDRMYGKGRPALPAYHLSVKLRTSEEDLGILANATTALAAVHAFGDYELKDASGKTLTKGSTQSTATYDKLTSLYASQAAHDGALERTVREVSDQITGRLSLYFSEKPTTP